MLGYKFFLAAAGMPKDCADLRLKLQIEFQRLLSWAEAADLVGYEAEGDLPEALRTDKLILVAILSQVTALLDEFANLNGRYEQLEPDEAAEEAVKKEDVDYKAGFASLALRYEKNAKKRRYWKGTNHVLAMVKNVKDVALEPKRLWWVAFDRSVFQELLRRLEEFNNYLHELLHGHYARKLEETTRNTYLEMIEVRSTVEDLRSLIAASMVLSDHDVKVPRRSRLQELNYHMLKSLAELKEQNIGNDADDDEKPPSYYDVVGTTTLSASSIQYESEATAPLNAQRLRSVGSLSVEKEKTTIWIEWKSYKTVWGRDEDRIPFEYPAESNVKRIKELVSLLKRPHIAEFLAPRCLGYFDDYENDSSSNKSHRFGIVYTVSATSKSSSVSPVSLLEAIEKEPCPSLSVRVAFAHKIATSVLYLHTVGWLHKGLRGDSVIFLRDTQTQELDFNNPLLSGFEYARPDRDGLRSTSAARSPGDELYVHPSYQGDDARGTYRKTFDVYSLGLILLELVCWEPIQDIMKLGEPSKIRADDLKMVRERLIESGSPFLARARANAGEKFFEAVKSCVVGPTAFGIKEDANEHDAMVGSLLQRQFMGKVVENLAGIVL